MRRGALGPTVAQAPALAAAPQNSCPTTCPAALNHRWEQRALREAGSVPPTSMDEKLRQNYKVLVPASASDNARPRNPRNERQPPGGCEGPCRSQEHLPCSLPLQPWPSRLSHFPGSGPRPDLAETTAKVKAFSRPSAMRRTPALPAGPLRWRHRLDSSLPPSTALTLPTLEALTSVVPFTETPELSPTPCPPGAETPQSPDGSSTGSCALHPRPRPTAHQGWAEVSASAPNLTQPVLLNHIRATWAGHRSQGGGRMYDLTSSKPWRQTLPWA